MALKVSVIVIIFGLCLDSVFVAENITPAEFNAGDVNEGPSSPDNGDPPEMQKSTPHSFVDVNPAIEEEVKQSKRPPPSVDYDVTESAQQSTESPTKESTADGVTQSVDSSTVVNKVPMVGEEDNEPKKIETKPLIDDSKNSLKNCGKYKLGANHTRKAGIRSKSLITHFPWTVAFEYNFPTILNFHCGGAIIDERWIVTVAHCIEGLKPNFKVVVATNDLSKIDEKNKFEVDKVVVHPNYTDDPIISNNIALLRLATALDLSTDQINAVCLPEISQDLTRGLTAAEYDPWVTHTLMKQRFFTYTEERCKKTLKDQYIENEVICVRIPRGTQHCAAFAGGPLVKKRNEIATLVGILSYKFHCESRQSTRRVRVYVLVSKYVDWIKNTIQDNAV